MEDVWAVHGRRAHKYVATITPAQHAEWRRQLWYDEPAVFMGAPVNNERQCDQCARNKARSETPEQMVVDQTACSLEKARAALALKNNDVIEAIMHLYGGGADNTTT
jgi:NACalpha-BTF3-like transcription factor